jgi:hypothetical protein
MRSMPRITAFLFSRNSPHILSALPPLSYGRYCEMIFNLALNPACS